VVGGAVLIAWLVFVGVGCFSVGFTVGGFIAIAMVQS
jgi:hypothetical protein